MLGVWVWVRVRCGLGAGLGLGNMVRVAGRAVFHAIRLRLALVLVFHSYPDPQS